MGSVRDSIGFIGRMILKDPRLIWSNIKERLLFDWIYGLDTVRQIPKENYIHNLHNLEYGLHYSSSWTSEIVFGFKSALKYLNGRFASFQFVDVGCGKGKVQIVWEKLLRRKGLTQNVCGLDYYDDVLVVARNNHSKMFDKPGVFIQADASRFEFYPLGSSILYLYNPFDGVILKQMIDGLKRNEVFLIYNNPVHEDILLDAGFALIERKDGFHPQAITRTYYRNAGDV